MALLRLNQMIQKEVRRSLTRKAQRLLPRYQSFWSTVAHLKKVLAPNIAMFPFSTTQ